MLEVIISKVVDFSGAQQLLSRIISCNINLRISIIHVPSPHSYIHTRALKRSELFVEILARLRQCIRKANAFPLNKQNREITQPTLVHVPDQRIFSNLCKDTFFDFASAQSDTSEQIK